MFVLIGITSPASQYGIERSRELDDASEADDDDDDDDASPVSSMFVVVFFRTAMDKDLACLLAS